MQLDKRTWDDRLYDIDCSDLLDPDETIVSGVVKADPQNQVNGEFTTGLVFGDVVVNPAPIIYPKLGRCADIGKAVQFLISGGIIPVGATSLCATVRLRMVTTKSPQLEATVSLRLTDEAT